MCEKKAKILIIGIGNILMRDEGIGIWAIRQLFDQGLHENQDVEIVDAGTEGIGMLEYMKDKEKIIIIDAIDFQEPPGTLYRFNFNDSKSYKQGRKYSIHQIDALDAIDLLHNVHNQYPEIVVIGMQPFEIEIDMQLSKGAQQKLGSLVDIVIKEIPK